MGSVDVVIVGAGVIGAACAEALSAAGQRVLVLDRGSPTGGTTAAGEGNVLVSDKEPGPELELAQESRRYWPLLLASLREELGAKLAEAEWDAKGGLVVALGETDATALAGFAETQRAAGVDARVISVDEVREREPHLTDGIRAAVYYPEDAQLQPVLAASALLSAVRARGGAVRGGVAVTGVGTDASGAVSSVNTSDGAISCRAVVNACGPWAGEFARAAGAPIAVLPRRGMVLVTAPLPDVVRHKVYDADYVGATVSGDADLQTSTVVESTRAGTVLIGSSRQRVGFDETIRVEVLRELARKAVGLFPVLGNVPVMRAYGGFRPYTPDHLPVIGADPRLPGLWHATGHEGAGIGLAAATGRLLADQFLGRESVLDPEPFRVDRPALLEGATA
ncbi:NAD(P)/FAD-dependent oxidoreductase [Stackebrandtia nassauensis]|uniref:FAD dependent oxidoreductase n=1 Tax=Stackebrandtia nassauensis (strain DSM 44728 / CIP 108903 / NRRL B-16338 / NBRC 102104 / LLR-40K-21) TaxID=446470 RepID=D3Q108_STANL|nr:FAD-binding oxidoreductase [Stackebrandtia nassauensis]ADD43758.1 FAD dependent oxidoreductase [Stackebrandtia nassauensis DSM 44728]